MTRCPVCGAPVSCAEHEASFATALEQIAALEKELAVAQIERAESTRKWIAARAEVARLADKIAALEKGKT